MKAITAIGIAVAFVSLFLAAILEGTNPVTFLNIPALVLIAGGTIGATMASTNFRSFMTAPKGAIMSFKGTSIDSAAAIGQMVELSEKARRNGLLALEEDVAKIDDAYTRKGLQLVVDGTDSDLVHAILESEIDGLAARHAVVAGLFTTAGGFAPTVGIIGTVMGLIHVLQNLAAPAELGPAISGAFIATLYGVAMANIIFLPTANRLAGLSKAEVELRTMTLEGILGIQAGDNPRILAEKLQSFIPPAERGAEVEDSGAGAAAAAPSAEAAAEAA
jgi:chemotaxis protein MotA